MHELDSVDLKIVELLMEDGRMPSSGIARRLGDISERSVRYRIDRLVRQGIIRISAIANPQALGYAVVADVFIEVEPGEVLEVARKLAEYECVSYVACSTGERDISIQIVAHDNTELYTFVTEVVGHVPGVRRTMTSIVPIILKDVYQWRIPASVGSPDGRVRQTADGGRQTTDDRKDE
jgi:Lrp/AsnC family transcriptional regulator for asnA, asnC and gidA